MKTRSKKVGPGRPPEDDPKETFDVRLKTSKINKVGRAKLRAKIQEFVEGL